MTPLLDALRLCAQRLHAPFYTPGHKRGRGVLPAIADLLGAQAFKADLPELPELDNLFAPDGVIQAAQELAAQAFGSDRTWFLTNGSTSGIIAAILATCNPGDGIILPRTVHQSAISGLILSGAMPIFVAPEYDAALDIAHSLSPERVAAALRYSPQAKAVLMVSPTYYGVCGNVAAIAQLCHAHAIPLIVDEAHGSHFAFHPDLPTPALAAGADLVVQSIHKTLSSLTQSAMLHVQGERIDRDRLNQSLQLVQSTSPSYLLLASLDAARHQMATQGTTLMQQTLDLAAVARSHLAQIPGLSVLEAPCVPTPGFVDLDRTRLTVTVANLGITGFAADTVLHTQLGVTAEYPSLRHLTFILSLGNTPEEIQQLVQALTLLAELKIAGLNNTESSRLTEDADLRQENPLTSIPAIAQPSLSPRQAFFSPTETVATEWAVNRISAELVCPYPPGIPALLPGERITTAAIAQLQQTRLAGGTVTGCADPSLETLRVIQQSLV